MGAPLLLLHAPVPVADASARQATVAVPRAAGTAGDGSELVGYHANPSVPSFPVGDGASTTPPTAVPTTTTTSTAPPPTTTTTTPAPPPTITTSVPAPAAVTGTGGSVTGEATWYSEAPPGGCASPTLPFGTEVQVTNVADGATTSCVVDDREASNPGRVLDMSYSGFSVIADPSQGVVTVTLSW
ncbi:MAG: septal ring lytic transglycosylase RlpA family protein [Acidimicrobiales bacterium]